MLRIVLSVLLVVSLLLMVSCNRGSASSTTEDIKGLKELAEEKLGPGTIFEKSGSLVLSAKRLENGQTAFFVYDEAISEVILEPTKPVQSVSWFDSDSKLLLIRPYAGVPSIQPEGKDYLLNPRTGDRVTQKQKY